MGGASWRVPDRTGRRLLSLWVPVALLMAAIFVVSSIGDVPAPPGGMTDKQAHGLVYAALAGVTLRALAGGRFAGVTIIRMVAAWTVAVLYGATDEGHQYFVPGRVVEAADLLADGVGAAAAMGAAGAWGIIRRFSGRRTPTRRGDAA